MSVARAPALARIDHAWHGLFPLKLSPIEATFILADCGATFPMMADLKLEFDGLLDRKIFTSALKAALARNPLFCSIVGRDRKLGQVWLLTDEMPSIDWAPQAAPLGDRYDEPVDLTKEIGLRIWVRHTDERTTVLLHFHHACSDALGAFAFIEDLLALYSSRYPGGPAVALRPLDPRRLLKRGLQSTPRRRWYQQPLDVVLAFGEAVTFLWRAPAELASPHPPTADRRAKHGKVLTRSLGPELTSRLRSVATQAGATVNDVLLCDLFATIRRWNAAHGKRTRWLRIMVPQNLREPEDSATPAANIMGFAFLTRHATGCDSSVALMPSMHVETRALRRERVSAFFLRTVAAALSLGVSGKFLASKRCFATVIMTNLGLPTRRFVARFPQAGGGLVVGNTVFRALTGAPPLRAGTRAAFAVISSFDDLTLALKCDPHFFGPQDAERLLDEYIKQIAAGAARPWAAPATGRPACGADESGRPAAQGS